MPEVSCNRDMVAAQRGIIREGGALVSRDPCSYPIDVAADAGEAYSNPGYDGGGV